MKTKDQNRKATKRAPRSAGTVKSAILEATEKLLLKHGSTEITVRQIAEAANVKHPMIYRHFGSKHALIMTVHARQVLGAGEALAQVTEIEGNVRTFFDSFDKSRWRQVALARAMIDEVDPRTLQNRFPIMELFVRLLRERLEQNGRKTGFQPEELAAGLSAMAMGWVFFRPFLAASTGLDDRSPEELNDLAVAVLEELIDKLC
jgi:AcrR family transcriptional regulator